VAFSPFPDLMIGSSLNSTGKPTTALLLIGTITFTSFTLTCDKKYPRIRKTNRKQM
jgi:hypothetical protein